MDTALNMLRSSSLGGKAGEGTDGPGLLHREIMGGPGLPLRQDPGTGILVVGRCFMAHLLPFAGTPSLDPEHATLVATSSASMPLHIASIDLIRLA